MGIDGDLYRASVIGRDIGVYIVSIQEGIEGSI
jgi:hypothetical protein